MISLENHSECVRAKCETLIFVCFQSFFFLFFFFLALAYERIFIKTHSTESRCVLGPEVYCFRGIRASFTVPENVQAGAVLNGLTLKSAALPFYAERRAGPHQYSEGEAAWVVDWRTH